MLNQTPLYIRMESLFGMIWWQILLTKPYEAEMIASRVKRQKRSGGSNSEIKAEMNGSRFKIYLWNVQLVFKLFYGLVGICYFILLLFN